MKFGMIVLGQLNATPIPPILQHCKVRFTPIIPHDSLSYTNLYTSFIPSMIIGIKAVSWGSYTIVPIRV